MLEKGLDIKKAIFDEQERKFSSDLNVYYWFTVLRKLYQIQSDPDKNDEDFKTNISNLAVKINEALSQDSSIKFRLIPRSTDLYLAVENNKIDKVEEILRDFPEEEDFLSSIIMIPGTLFPFGSIYHDKVSASPLGNVIALALLQPKLGRGLMADCSYMFSAQSGPPQLKKQSECPTIRVNKLLCNFSICTFEHECGYDLLID